MNTSHEILPDGESTEKWAINEPGFIGVGDMRTKANGRSYHKICNAIYEDARRKKGAS